MSLLFSFDSKDQRLRVEPLRNSVSRVVRNDGELGGHRWGVGRKQALLAKESSGP